MKPDEYRELAERLEGLGYLGNPDKLTIDAAAAALREADAKLNDRGITHAEGCWAWGPRHYSCAEAEIERLRAAIETHRNNVWGSDGDVGHPEDECLYAALEASDET